MPIQRDADSETVVEIDVAGNDPDPAQVCMDREIIELIKTAVAAEAEANPLTVRILECYDAEIEKPAEIAQLLEVDVKEIYNARKRLQRRAHRALASRGKERR